jgi:hypothetical protein
MRKDRGWGGGVERNGAAAEKGFAEFSTLLWSSRPPPQNLPFSSHTNIQKVFNLLCPMFWQITVEISPFFLLTLFTYFLLHLLSYSVSIYFILSVDRFFYTWRNVHGKQKKKIINALCICLNIVLLLVATFERLAN